jgi:predicted TIM-barrel fold metal-dependent hydrolase
MTIFDEPKIDCHAHIFDPVAFPYRADTPYRPSGQELGNLTQYYAVMNSYGVKHALLVQPNSGYAEDNSYILHAIKNGAGRFKGMAIIDRDADAATLRKFKSHGVIGAAINPTFHGNDYYKDIADLMKRLADEDMFFNLQIERDQFEMFAPWIRDIPVKVMIDHNARPTVADGLGQPGFSTMLKLADTGRVAVKISGYAKYARTPYPFEDCWPYVRAIIGAYTPEHCVWASDWPFLRAAERQDYGPLVALAARLFPDESDRRKVLWETPKRLFGFAG